VIIVAVALVGTGFFLQTAPMRETVIRVNGVSFKMDYYIQMFELIAKSQQSPADLDYNSLADVIAQDVEETELVRQAAEKLGYTVTEDELDKKLAEYIPPSGSEDHL